jgi:adenine-specific DNA methylase
MSSFESKRLEIYEKYIQPLPEQVKTDQDQFIFPSFTRNIAHEDGYNEADFIIEIASDGEERELVLMSSTVRDGNRELLSDITDSAAQIRARKYAGAIDDGAYYGVMDGEQVHVQSLDPDIGFERTVSLTELPEIIEAIIEEEKRIRDSEEFISTLRDYYEDLTPHVRETLATRVEEDAEFEADIRRFLAPIGQDVEEDEPIPGPTLDMLSRQATYLIIDKVLFYFLIRENENELRKGIQADLADEVFGGLQAPQAKLSGEMNEAWASDFWDTLMGKFDLIQKIDYEPIFDPTTSPLNSLTFEDSPGACLVLQEVMGYLRGKEELSELFDGPLLAKIYEGLIPPDVRWKWGQIYTPPEVARLITSWTVTDGEDTVLDPSCGTGRFLVSAYERLSELQGLDRGENHQEILEQIHGVDINQFPAHLATMSLVAMSLQSVTKKVNIEVRDFFTFRGGDQSSLFASESTVMLGGEEESLADPDGEYSPDMPLGKMDSVLMNPPYTRQEALGETYKENVRDVALSGLGDAASSMSSQAAFYVYFMTHATKFLKDDGGRVGIIIQNSWMDALYGKDVQEFLLDNYRIEAIIGTQRDRMIKTADVNTVILFLERETEESKRDNNEVRFVQLKHSPEWFETNYGFEQFLDIVEENESLLNDEDMRIVSRSQSELREENKWGRFIRAPDVYFDQIAHRLTERLEDVADVSLGLTSGLNSFFYIKQSDIDEWDIEEEYVRPLVKSPRECHTYRISLDDLNKYVLDVQKDKTELKDTNVLDYIEHGEQEGVHERPFFSSKTKANWYKKKMQNAALLQPYNVNTRHFTCINEMDACVDKRLVCVDTQSDIDPDFVFSYLNSTLGILVKELFGRASLGEGALDNSVTDAQVMPVLDPDLLGKSDLSHLKNAADGLKNRSIMDIYEELGATDPDEISIDQVDEHRRAVDKVLMEDVLKLSTREQLQIYRGALQLVKDRMDKAASGN